MNENSSKIRLNFKCSSCQSKNVCVYYRLKMEPYKYEFLDKISNIFRGYFDEVGDEINDVSVIITCNNYS